jgi:hypothetical protein
MSSIIDVIPTPVIEKVKPERKPTLPAKYAKFMQFGFWFAGQIKDKVLDETAYNSVIHALAVFDDLSVQTDLYQSFLDKDNIKDNNKTLRKAIAAHKKELAKANAPPKKPRASKKKADADDATVDNAEKVKKPRAPKKKSADLVDELVTLASGEPAVPPDAPSLSKELPPPVLDDKAAKKAADKAEKDAKKAADKAEKEAKKAAEKADKPKKTAKKEPKKTAATVVAEKPSDNDLDEEA